MVRGMTDKDTAWQVHDHGEIQKLSENLWWMEGSLPGMSLRRCMTVVKLADGRLVIHGAIAMREPEMQQLEAWGTPAFLIVPNGYHRLDAPRYKQRYPEIKVLAPRGSRKKIEEKISVDGGFPDFPADEMVTWRALAGVREREGVMQVRSKDGVSVVFNDVVMNMDKKKDFLGNLITTVMGSAPGPRVSRLAKFALVADQTATRKELEAFAAIPDLQRVIVGHEKVSSGADARACLQGAMTFLKSS